MGTDEKNQEKKKYHRTTANERKRANMAKLMNNSGPCSVSIVLHVKQLRQGLTEAASEIKLPALSRH